MASVMESAGRDNPEMTFRVLMLAVVIVEEVIVVVAVVVLGETLVQVEVVVERVK